MTAPNNLPDASSPASPRDVVDWGVATSVGRRLVKPGPVMGPGEASAVVADLRAAAAEAREPVARTARMESLEAGGQVLIVDRPGWIEANVAMMRALMEPVAAKMTAAVAAKAAASSGSGGTGSGGTGSGGIGSGGTGSAGIPNPAIAALGAKATGAESGALLAFMASKVLGQYDLAPGATPRLMLVAPNIVAAEQEMGVDPHDFRRWVAMHEETHRVQFTAVPWLRDFMLAETGRLLLDLAPTPEDASKRLAELAKGLPEAIKGLGSGMGLVELVMTPEQRAAIARITAIMALLEGHADVVMDEVGPQEIPTVAQIRAKFEERRQGAGSLDRVLRRLLGLDAKMRQYRDGAKFVRGVQSRVGIDGFNAVWTSPDTLPTPEEISDPGLWVKRVHG